MFGRNRVEQLETEAVELARAISLFGEVDLVDRQRNRLVGSPQGSGDLLISGQQPRLPIDDEQDRIRLLDGDPGLVLHLCLEVRTRGGVEARRVYQQEPAPDQAHFFGDAVPGHTGQVLHQGATVPRVAIEQSRLSDIGSPDDGDDGQRRGLTH